MKNALIGLFVAVWCLGALGQRNEPSVAMVCGKCSQYRDLVTGEWKTNIEHCKDCTEDKTEILKLCNLVYPGQNFNKVQLSASTEPIGHWCKLAVPKASCTGHVHKIYTHLCLSSPVTADKPSHCLLHKYTGPCRASFLRFYFDNEDGECKQFTYGGCQGNKNNFLSKEECESSCKNDNQPIIDPLFGVGPVLLDDTMTLDNVSPPSPPKPKFKDDDLDVDVEPNPICFMERDTGPCRAAFQHFYYDSNEGTCKQFIYGGCKGNDNNFMSQSACESVCSGAVKPSPKILPTTAFPQTTDPVCLLERVTGPCRASFMRYHFDATKGECKTFVYGGCDGNENNFMTEQDCLKLCVPGKVPERAEDIVAKYVNKPPVNETHENNLFNSALNSIDKKHQSTLNGILAQWEQDDDEIMENSLFSTSEKNLKLQKLEKDLQEKLRVLNADHLSTKQHVKSLHNDRKTILVKTARSDAYDYLIQAMKESFQPKDVLKQFQIYLDSEKNEFNHYKTIADQVGADTDQRNDVDTALTQLKNRANTTRDMLRNSFNTDNEIISQLDVLFLNYFPSTNTIPSQSEVDSQENYNPEIDFIDEVPSDIISESDNELIEIENPAEDDDGDLDIDYGVNGYNGEKMEYDDPIDDFNPNNVQIVDPQPLYEGPKMAYLGGKGWLLWAGVAVGALFLVVLIAIFASNKKNSGMRGTQNVAVPAEDSVKTTATDDLTAEQKEILLMQQNGYENPTYKFFEKQKA